MDNVTTATPILTPFDVIASGDDWCIAVHPIGLAEALDSAPDEARYVAAGANMVLDGGGALAIAAAGDRPDIVAKLLSLGAPRTALHDITLSAAVAARYEPFTEDVRTRLRLLYMVFGDEDPILSPGVKAVIKSYDMHAKLMADAAASRSMPMAQPTQTARPRVQL